MITQNTFTGGMVKDLNPLTTPNTVLRDALNATIITFDGEEFILQNDKGNVKVERAKLSTGYIPVGMEEYGGIVYVASYNPETGQSEIGSFPSPERDFSTSDFGNIQPINFKEEEFVVSTGQGEQEKTTIIRKLVEPELLELSPGDMYVVVFDINSPSGQAGADVITNVTKMNEYISKDVSDRKLFRLKFYKFVDSSTKTELNPDDIKVIENQSDLEDEYVFFKENSSGTIGVGLELETLDNFEVNVVDISRRTQETKSAVIEAVGFSDSLADFKGVKVDVVNPEAETFYIEKTTDVKKVSATITDLLADSKLSGTITPYSDYALYPKLSRAFDLNLGEYAFAGTGVNDIFRYYVENNYIKVDFDFKFQGDNSNGLTLYVEFYDPWSDYSVVKVVDNPTYYGANSIQLELIDEPRVDVFNTITRGGTPVSEVILNSDTDYQKTMLNSTNEIRTTAKLRKNHFYIVRISGIDTDYSGNTPIHYHYDLYKGLYTNTLLNETYTNQNLLPITDPNYIRDFNTIDFKIQDMIKYSSKITESLPVSVKSSLINLEDNNPSENNKYYNISNTQIPGGSYKAGYNYTKSVTTDVDLTLSGEEYIFGNLKTGIVGVEFPNLDPLAGPVDPLLTPTVEDLGYVNTYPQINPASLGKWELQTLNSLKFRLNKSLSTSRWVYADKIEHVTSDGQPLRRVVKKNVPLAPFFQGLNDIGFEFNARNINLNGNSVKTTCKDDKFQPSVAKQLIDTYYPGVRPAIIYAFGRSQSTDEIPNSCQYNTYAARRRMAIRIDDGFIWEDVSLAMVRDTNGYYPTQITLANRATLNAAYPFLNIHSAVDSIIYVYYANNNAIRYNDSIITQAKFDNFYYNIKYSRIASTKTYLSTFRFKALDNISEFNTSVINNYIAARKGSSDIVDDKDTINDGFIPYIDADIVQKTNIDTSDIVITEAAASNLVTAFSQASNIWNLDPVFNSNTSYTHGQIFSSNPMYDDIAKIFSVVGVSTNVEILPQNITLHGNPNGNITYGGWKGLLGNNVKGNERNYTDRYNIQINI